MDFLCDDVMNEYANEIEQEEKRTQPEKEESTRKVIIDGKERSLHEFEDTKGNINIENNGRSIKTGNIQSKGNVVLTVGSPDMKDNTKGKQGNDGSCMIQ